MVRALVPIPGGCGGTMITSNPNDWKPFTQMCAIIPEGESGIFKVQHFAMSEGQVKMEQLRDTMHGNYWESAGLEPDVTYTRLVTKYVTWMSATPMERRTNRAFVQKAHGRVLVAGLGIGLVLVPLLRNPLVEHVDAVESCVDVVNLVETPLRKYLGRSASR